jgi:hypothetical protein
MKKMILSKEKLQATNTGTDPTLSPSLKMEYHFIGLLKFILKQQSMHDKVREYNSPCYKKY